MISLSRNKLNNFTKILSKTIAMQESTITSLETLYVDFKAGGSESMSIQKRILNVSFCNHYSLNKENSS